MWTSFWNGWLGCNLNWIGRYNWDSTKIKAALLSSDLQLPMLSFCVYILNISLNEIDFYIIFYGPACTFFMNKTTKTFDMYFQNPTLFVNKNRLRPSQIKMNKNYCPYAYLPVIISPGLLTMGMASSVTKPWMNMHRTIARLKAFQRVGQDRSIWMEVLIKRNSLMESLSSVFKDVRA